MHSRFLKTKILSAVSGVAKSSLILFASLGIIVIAGICTWHDSFTAKSGLNPSVPAKVGSFILSGNSGSLSSSFPPF